MTGRAAVAAAPSAPARVVFVTYDGALDSLGGSQVVPYLLALSRQGVSSTLVSFEKPERWSEAGRREQMQARLSGAGIRWRALRYHRWPRLLATAWDVCRGALAITQEVLRSGARLVQGRGDVAMATARLARVPRGTRLIYEVRGLFSDERVEIGSWRPGSLVDRLVRRVEAGNLRRADGVLAVMSPHGCAELARRRDPLPPHRSLPNSVDLAAFTPRPRAEAPRFGLAYCGSLGGWYLTPEMVEFAREASRIVPGRPLFLTPDLDLARSAGISEEWAELRSVAPGEVPGWLAQARATFFLIRATPAKRASSPTKLPESLALGLPVVANTGVGDVDGVLEAERVGVIVDAFGADAYRRAATKLMDLLADPETPARCRRVAESRYSLGAAVAKYQDLYRELLAGGDYVHAR